MQAGGPLYSGAVVATPATGPAVRVPVGFFKEPERYDLTLKAVGRDGQPATLADAGVMNVDDGELFADFLFFDEDASVTIRVAPGSYHIMGYVVGGGFDTVSMVGDPEVEVTGPTTFTLDARRAEPVTTGIEGVATDPNFVDLGYTGSTPAAATASRPATVAGSWPRVAVRRADRPGLVGQFEVELRTGCCRPGPASATAATLYDLLLYGGRVPDPPSWVLSAAERARLAGSPATTAPSTTTPTTRTCGSGFAPCSSSPAAATSRSRCRGPGSST